VTRRGARQQQFVEQEEKGQKTSGLEIEGGRK